MFIMINLCMLCFILIMMIYKFMLLILMVIELMILNISVMIYMIFSLMSLEVFMIYYLIFSVCESVLGLMLLILIVRYNGNDFYYSLNLFKI